MLLSDVEIGGNYRLEACTAPFKTQCKLETLGLVLGGKIKLIQRTGAGVILEVKNSRLALARDLAKNIEVAVADEAASSSQNSQPVKEV